MGLTLGGTSIIFNDGTTQTTSAAGVVSLALNGYQKLPSGLIVQWCRGGAYSTGNYNTSWSLTFPIAFPTACLNVVSSGYFTAQGSQNQSVCQVGSFTTTGATGMFFSGNNGNAGATMYPVVFAVGY